MSTASTSDAELFALRLARSGEDLWEPLERLYGAHPGYGVFRKSLTALLEEAWEARPPPLRRLDLERDLNSDWFQRPDQVGYVFYIDRFAGTLRGVLDHIDYLKALGVTYVHFMPCLKPRAGENDGGYSVEDYREINPALGTMADFEAVAAVLRAEGIGVCIDLVLNHTAESHAWARAARAGDAVAEAYYHVFADDTLPRQYEETLLEIFPDVAPGNFTFDEDLQKWVWTTFHTHQWDLNWTNPQVFLEIAEIMLFLLNKGAETLRLDAVAFMWKEMGTLCQNLDPVHDILQSLRAVSRIVAPGSLLKAEAIVPPKELVAYLGKGTRSGRVSNLAYHNNLMVQFWSSLAARDTRLMAHVLGTHFPAHFANATWGTYLRCHDDIGWAITEEDAEVVGWDAFQHRQFLADFYEGVFPGSFARGGLFQFNPETLDKRNNGTLASLAGLEAALESGDPVATDDAVARILLGHALIASFGGLPLIYMGDELGMLNVPGDHEDTRAMQRPVMEWARAEKRSDPATVEGRIFAGITHILARRRATPQLHGRYPTEILESPNPAVFAFRRAAPGRPLVALFNFTEAPQAVPLGLLGGGISAPFDALAEVAVIPVGGEIRLAPYGVMWLVNS
ncbi:MAG: alpha-amylase family glycosyl hydrolase [Pseudomonadota bacterium]